MIKIIKGKIFHKILRHNFSLQKNVFLVRTLNNGVNLARKFSAVAQSENEPIIKPRVNPLSHPDYFNVEKMFKIRDLMEARVHFGHTVGSLNDRMKPYLFGSRLNHTIFDLNQTAEHLKRALNVTAHTALQGGIILFFARSAINAHIVEKTALECEEFAHTKYWRGGTFTNSRVQFKSVTRKCQELPLNYFSNWRKVLDMNIIEFFFRLAGFMHFFQYPKQYYDTTHGH